MTQRERLIQFVENTLHEHDKEVVGDLVANTSLLKSCLFDSLAILQLAAWIEEEINSVTDLSSVNIEEEWDSMDCILSFIEKHDHPGK